uniref:EOG090X05SW n=1 Tax=Eubosmina coregoni TaxID=186181 RepID=A0A4Y7LNI5_9CRUS|nr:EOG090X05SW [Eubosmina coregoni]SVE69786.1 EOG090X05SW [Eubosmina coregoni]
MTSRLKSPFLHFLPNCFEQNQDATAILQANEKIYEVTKPGSVIKSIDWNQLASNNPLEDSLAIAQLCDNKSYLLGVFDGHGGPACARVLAKRLLSYIAASLPSQHISSLLIEQMTPTAEFRTEVESLYAYEFNQYHASVSHLRDTLSANDVSQASIESTERALLTAFEAMDQQLSEEALAFLLGPEMADILQRVPRWDWKPWWKDDFLSRDKTLQLSTLSAAMSGAVASVVHVSSNNLVLANTGDCQAVVGFINEDSTWCARKLGREHTAENAAEVERLYSEHPRNEQDTVLRMDRLLGQLMPLRAFGDFRFKWPRHVLEKWVSPVVGETALPPNYKTPPYLTARPELTHYTLSPRDKFLVIASDGLWDLLSPTQVVRLVGEHMSGRVALGPLTLPPGDVSLNEINSMLQQRREGLSKRPLDTNAATHLIRHALASTETGLDQDRLSELLSLPDDVVRLFRDDITIIVAYFDTDYLLKSHPPSNHNNVE